MSVPDRRLMMSRVENLVASARRIGVLVLGSTLTLVGIALLILPGPGVPLIIAGLALLGTQFAWARRWLAWLRAHLSAAFELVRARVQRNR
jgi:uncharacterized protein (TIGR02611 family)